MDNIDTNSMFGEFLQCVMDAFVNVARGTRQREMPLLHNWVHTHRLAIRQREHQPKKKKKQMTNKKLSRVFTCMVSNASTRRAIEFARCNVFFRSNSVDDMK